MSACLDGMSKCGHLDKQISRQKLENTDNYDNINTIFSFVSDCLLHVMSRLIKNINQCVNFLDFCLCSKLLTEQWWHVTCSEGRTLQQLECGSIRDAFPVRRRAICSAVSNDRMQWSQAKYLYAAFHANWALTSGCSMKIISPSA